jgi:hypothetical protein
LGWVKTAVGQSFQKLTRDEFESLVVPELVPHFEVGGFHRLVRRKGMLAAQLDLSGVMVSCVGEGLIDPPRRTVAVDVDTHYKTAGRAIDPPAGSAAHAWRRLGLVDERGHPTRRGEIVSLFQGGEGLVVAAALEEPSYPVAELAWHLANVRAGYRFRETEGGGSSRLAAAARSAYGLSDHEGYLEIGLPIGYGEGAAEVLQDALLGAGRDGGEQLAAGDVERAKVEWLSLLRHVTNAPAPEWDRWEGLVQVCDTLLAKYGRVLPKLVTGELDAVTSGHRPRRVRRSDFPR